MLKKIRQFMARSGGAPLFNVATQRFHSIDRRALEVEIDLKARARKQGKANLPPPEQRSKDSLAMDIDTYLAQVVREGRNELNDHMAALRRADMVKTWAEYITERNTKFRAALTQLFGTAKNGVNALYLQREKVADSQRAYQQFRNEHDIKRPSDHTVDRPRALGWIIVLVICESLFNAYALGGAHPEGPVGVLVDTVGISVVNVVVLAWGMGYALRRYSRDDLIERIIGGAMAMFIALALAAPFNLFVAHYRDVLLSLQSFVDSGDIGVQVQDYMSTYKKTFSETWENAFSLDGWYKFGSTASALLLPIGIGMFIWAAAKWRYMEDVLPGYSRLDRAREQCLQEYETLASSQQEALRQIADQSAAQINGMHKMAVAALRNVEAHEATRRHLREKYVAWVNEVTTLGKALYAKYREINMQYREGEMPAAFEIPFQLPKDLVDSPALPAQNEPVSEKQVAAQHERVEKQNTLIAEGHNEYLKIYETIGELAPKDLADSMSMPFDDAVTKVNAELQTKAGRIQ
ncbi:MAG: hypothetical protein OXU88_09340 [Gammaproteobacteria bacterium]|nr:hypothetical protein [Gammaproteobacteria bacterium]